MKISIISNLYPPHVLGGYELGCAEIAERVAQAGHEVEVLTSRVVGRLHRLHVPAGTARIKRIFAPLFEYEKQPALHPSPEWHTRHIRAKAGTIPTNVSALLEEWKAFRPDVVWAFNIMGLGTLGILECLAYAGYPTVIHHMDFLDVPLGAHHAPLARVKRAKARLTAISCSELTRAKNEELGAYGNHLVIPNGIHFPTSPSPVTSRTGGEGIFRFICFGQITQEKGIVELLAAFQQLLSIRPDRKIHLTIQGPCHSPPFLDSLRGEILREGLHEAVTLAGPVPKQELLSGLSRYDTAVMLLNPQEAFGYAPLEAAAAGLPVIFPRSSGVASFLPEDDPLLLHERDNAWATAETMARCVDNPAWAADHALWQRKALMRVCDLEKAVLPAYLDVLHSLKPSSPVPNLEATLLANARMVEDHQIWQSATA